MTVRNASNDGPLINVVFPVTLTLVIAAVLLLTNSSIPFANGGSCDPWHYFGQYFLATQPDATLPIRDLARIPEFILGFILAHLFHGVAVHYLNFIILFVAATTAIYHAVKRLFGVVAATAAVIFFATQPLVIGDYSLTYTEASVTYSALAYAFAILSSTGERSPLRIVYLLLTGFFWATAIHAHLESLTMNFIVPLYCLRWHRRPFGEHLLDIAEKGTLVLAGGLIATALFGAINVFLLHGTFYFFLTQLHAVFTILIAPYEKPTWYLHAGRGALIVLGIGTCFFQGMALWRRRVQASSVTPLLTAIVPFGVMLCAQLVYTFFFYGLSLEYDYWFVWLIAPLTIALSSLLARASLTVEQATPIFAVYLVLSLFADLGRASESWPALWSASVPFAIALVFLVSLLWYREANRFVAVCAVLLCFSAMSATIRPEQYGLYAWTGHNQREVYQRIDAGMEFLATFHFPKTPKFWVNGRGDSWETIAYPRSYNYCLMQYLLPDLIDPHDPNYIRDNDKFLPGDYLVLAARSADELSLALSRLQDQGLTFQRLGGTLIAYKQLSYSLTVGIVH